MENQNIFNRIRANQSFFSGVEKRIAEAILSNPQKFVTYSMAELSKEAEVSQGSINNFAKKICGGGFATLKIEIAKQMSDYIPKPFDNVSSDDGIKNIINQLIEKTIIAFSNTLDVNSEETLQNCAGMILKAKRIEIYGVSQSGIVAQDFYYKLLQLGLPAMSMTDALMCSVSASMLSKDCLVVAVSSSGKTKEILDAVKIAKDNKVPVIAITANNNSMLVRMSDEALISLPSGTAVSGKTEEVRLSQLLLIDSLCEYIRHKTDESGERYLKIKEILSSHSVNE